MLCEQCTPHIYNINRNNIFHVSSAVYPPESSKGDTAKVIAPKSCAERNLATRKGRRCGEFKNFPVTTITKTVINTDCRRRTAAVGVRGCRESGISFLARARVLHLTLHGHIMYIYMRRIRQNIV